MQTTGTHSLWVHATNTLENSLALSYEVKHQLKFEPEVHFKVIIQEKQKHLLTK